MTELLANWRATYAEQHPHRDPAAMRITDAEMALGTYLLREIDLLRAEIDLLRKTRVIEPAFAEGCEARLSAKPKGRPRSRE